MKYMNLLRCNKRIYLDAIRESTYMEYRAALKLNQCTGKIPGYETPADNLQAFVASTG